MTLVFGYNRPGSALLMTDMLLSYDSRISSNHEMPMQFSPDSQIGTHGIAGLAQKLVIIHPTMAVGWAGPLHIAQAAIRRLASLLSFPASIEQVTHLVETDAALQNLVADVQIVFLIVNKPPSEDGRVVVSMGTINATWTPFSTGANQYTAGSGQLHFVEYHGTTEASLFNLENPAHQFVPLEVDLASYVSRFTSIIARELFDETPYNFRYGGGFELAVAHDDGTIRKLVCELALWLVKGDRLILRGPMFLPIYNDDGSLEIWRAPLVEEEQASNARFIVSPTIEEYTQLNRATINPHIVSHAIFSEDGQLTILTLINSKDQFQTRVSSDGELQIAIRSDFAQHVMGVTGTTSLEIVGARPISTC